ncbi:hypothetical protein TH63_04260 [Rufibacter radiotolerans]|uniref:Uncharacterized protein n=1 Tax=Rufibacter radiotolerans TaxID=1379910 RepID=A0A0H4VMA0_9BACT|nr:tetratricopeptide repeat protein [Rufibacter radiotolerans]AKQ45022.1 hypothetical protein TH63_04260 [Rufibacter radiotolerans]
MQTINQDRALLLLQQKKYDLAEKELRSALTEDVHNGLNHAYLALCLLHLNKPQEALQEAQQAIAEEPDLDYAFYILSLIHLQEERLAESERAIWEALTLEPYEATYHFVLGSICFSRSQWKEALASAEEGLAVEPEDVSCLNLKARALNRLGHKEMATESFGNAFLHAPDNHQTHTNQGWVYLEQAQYKQALHHFQEALRLNPTSDFAREGLVEALKAKYWIYRGFLQFSYKMASLSGGARWGMYIGMIILVRVMPLLLPFYFMLIFFTWFSDLIFNTMLRFNRYGRHALSQEQIDGSNLFLALFLGGISALVTNFAIDLPEAGTLGIVLLGMLFPVAGTLQLEYKAPRRKSTLITWGIATLGAATVITQFIDPALSGNLLTGFYICVLGYTWIRASL